MRRLHMFEKFMKNTCECKVDCIGTGIKDKKQLRVLGRVVSIGDAGVSYGPDQRPVEVVCQHLGIEAGNSCVTPREREKVPKGEAAENRARRLGNKTVNDNGEDEQDIDDELVDEELTMYQTLSARLNYLALDRADIQFSVKELMRKMSKPYKSDVQAPKRVARFLLGAPRVIQELPWQRRPNELLVHVDSDFAGCQTMRKSTSGGTIRWGSSMLKSWRKTQSVIALFIGKAELAAIVKRPTEALGMKSLLADFGVWVRVRICSDASAAIGMVNREGLGRVRHLAVAALWVQSKRASGEINFEKIDGNSNPADMLTKGVDEEKL